MDNIMDSTKKIRELENLVKQLKKELKKEKFNNAILKEDLDWYRKEYPVEVEINGNLERPAIPGCACVGGTDCHECADCIDE